MPNPSSPSDSPAESRPGPSSTPSDDTAHRDALRILLSRATRCVLLPDEADLLRQHVETELAAGDKARRRGNIWKAKAIEIEAHRDQIAADLDRTRSAAKFDRDAECRRAEKAEDLLRAAHDTSNRSEAERARAVQRAEQAEAERDGAYRERAQLVAHLAALHPSHIGHTDPNAPEWAVVIVETPAGQMSWHVSPRDMDLFEHVQPTNRICRGWDGHTTEEKYERLRHLIAAPITASTATALLAALDGEAPGA